MKRLTAFTVMAAGIWVVSGCKKAKNAAVVEEVPAATAAQDSAAALPDEPALQNVATEASESAQKSAPEGFDPSGRFVVQVGVFKSRSQAKRLKEKLSAEGYSAYVADVESPTPDLPGTYHRVRIGRFGTLAAAHDFGRNTMSGQGYEYWVDRKSNDHVGGGSSEEVAPSYSTPAATESYSTPSSSSSYSSEPSYSTPPAEPVVVPEPPIPAPSEPVAPQENSFGSPLADPASPSSETAVPVAPKDTAGALEGW